MNPERAVTRLTAITPDRLPRLAAELVEAVVEHAAADHQYEADMTTRRMVDAIRSFESGDCTVQGLRKAADEATEAAIRTKDTGTMAKVEATAAMAAGAATEAAVDYEKVARFVSRIIDLARELGVSESVLTEICTEAENNAIAAV